MAHKFVCASTRLVEPGGLHLSAPAAQQQRRSSTAQFPPLLVSATEARRLLSVGVTKFYQLVSGAELDTVLIGRRRHVVYESIVRYVNRLQRGAE